MKKLIARLGLRFAASLLNDKKTYIIAVGKILFGLAIVISYMFPEFSFLPEDDPEKALKIIMGGYGILFGAGTAAQRSATAKVQKQLKELQAPSINVQTAEKRHVEPFINPGHGVK